MLNPNTHVMTHGGGPLGSLDHKNGALKNGLNIFTRNLHLSTM